MGAAPSKIDDDKALQLCRERKKFVRQALDGRCSLAAAHVTYIQSLKRTGVALRKFVEPEAPVESSLYTSTSATPEPPASTEKSLRHFSFSPSLSHPAVAAENHSPSPSPPSSSRFQANHMKFRGFSSKKVEEKPPPVVTATVTSSSSPQNITPRSIEGQETSPFEVSAAPPESPPWDFFFHQIDHQFSSQDGKEIDRRLEGADDLRQLREEEGIPELEDEDEKASSYEGEESEHSEDEFDDPPTDTLVQSYVNRVRDHVVTSASPAVPSAESLSSETELCNGETSNSPDLSPLRTPASAFAVSTDTKKAQMKENHTENKVSPKDFFSSIKDIEFLFEKASDSGKEVPRMLEANKLHFRPIVQGHENHLVASSFLKACFSCGEEDPSQVQEEPAQTGVKYLTWHRTTSSRSSSSRNLLGVNAKDDMEDLTGSPLQNFCMISGSHSSTLDRLYVWERKLYDEVKASVVVRSNYDSKCKYLRQLESKGESLVKIDKTRADVKDLHYRIRVAIHRIDSISKRIEELRDRELQPQLEELIEGLSRMWEVMFECHKLQFNIISMAHNNANAKISVQSESHRQIAVHLENELCSLSSSFRKWIGSQKFYLEAVNNWIFKCVFIPQNTSRRKKRRAEPWQTLQSRGPPIFVTCGVWLAELQVLSVDEVAESIKGLAAEITGLLPRQEKNQEKVGWKADGGSDYAVNMLKDEASEDCVPGLEHFRSSLERFLGQLSNFAESSVKLYTELEQAIQDAKKKLEQMNSQSQVS